MKKKHLALIALLLLALVLPTLLVACKSEVEYSVTVLSPDEEPLQNITVNWMSGSNVAGSAKTDANGKATAKLPSATYNVTFADIEAGLEYTAVSVTAAMPNVTVTLEIKKIEYSVTVKDKDGAPAANVTVNWTNGGKIAGSAKTDANGKATATLNYADYTVTLSNLPEGNLSEGAQTVTGANPSAEFNLYSGAAMTYKVKVTSEGGLVFKKQSVIVYIEGDELMITSGETNDEGEFIFFVGAGNYIVAAENVPDGYSQAETKLTHSSPEGVIKLHSEPIATAPAANTRYVMGDIIHDYDFTTPYEINGKAWSSSIAKILETKEMIILNNWGTQCTWCVTEMPEMQSVYEKYSDKIEIIAVSNYNPADSDQDIRNYYATNGYTFPMMKDTNGFVSKFEITGHPTTVVIDRYGAIARIEVGAILSVEAWERLILKYIGDDYVQTFTPGDKESDSINNEIAKPDVEVPDNHYTQLIPEAINQQFPAGTTITYFGETEYEYAWPFLVDTVEGISPNEKVLFASNTGKPNSMSILYATVNAPVGKVLAFDYYTDCEDDDILHFVWDGKIIREISGVNADKGWQTCYLYTDITDGEHTLALSYIKDSTVSEGKDNVYVRRIRFVDIADIDQPTDMLRGAAYGNPEEGATLFPHYADVQIGSDGYYHVILNSLHNSSLAGVDESPLLLLNVLNVTNWNSKYSLNNLIMGVDENNQYVFNCTFTINGEKRDYRKDLARYLSVASASETYGMIPVDKFLHDMIVEFMPQVSGRLSHDNEWLEACYFYSHYGSTDSKDFVGNPIVGQMTETAIKMTEGTLYTANLTRNRYPFPTEIYYFIPEVSGIYNIKSFIPDSQAAQKAAQIWLYDDSTSASEPLAESGDERINLDAKNEQNFDMLYVMEAGHKYYIEVAFLMSESGTYEFRITKEASDEITRLEPASGDTFTAVLDSEGNITDQLILLGAIDYEKDADGYYHAKNANGTIGDFIYLDVLRANTAALGTIPLYKLVEMKVQSALPGEDGKIQYLDYKFFDFRYCEMYYYQEENGEKYVYYLEKVDLTENGAEYKDYTEILKAYIDSAPTSGDYKGLIKVNDELIKILSMFIELRINGVWADVTVTTEIKINRWDVEKALENEWLRFCWYNHTYKYEETTNE